MTAIMMNYRDEFSFKARVVEQGDDGGAAYSPSLWEMNNNLVMSSYESSPLLPCDHEYSNLSPRSRLQRIVEARKELMEMIQDMPESSYELSLKDIVDEHQLQQRTHREEEDYKEDDSLVADHERSFRFQTEAQTIKKQQKNKKKKKKKMQRMESLGSTCSNNKFSRSSSMDSEIFLIKMFFIPSCFGSTKKKSITHKNGSSKVSPRNSCDNDHKEARIKRIFSAGEKKGRGKTSSRSSSSSSNSDRITTSRIAGNFSPGCWPFLQIKKSKPKKQSGSIDVASE